MKGKKFILLFLITSALMFISCGGGGGDSAPSIQSPSTLMTGVFIDDPVKGLKYICSSGREGVTNSKGEYSCERGDRVTFSIGSLILGEVYASSEITPYTLFPSDRDAAANLVRLFHSIDINASDGVMIVDTGAVIPTDLNFSSSTFEDDISSFFSKPLISKEDALKSLDENLGRDTSTEIYHNGFGYNTIVSTVTGRIWLDRDLGASSVCSDFNDTSCYGDFYQWGRDTDGHEKKDSSLLYTFVQDINNAGGKFVVDRQDWIGQDLDGTIREKKWGNIEGESVCPINFRVPTRQEFLDENILVANFTLTNENTQEKTVTNVLKLATAGERVLDGSVMREGEMGTYWTGEAYGEVYGATWQYSIYPYTKYKVGSSAGFEEVRAAGKSVRCIMQEEISHDGFKYQMLKSPYTGRIWLDRNLGASKACSSSTDSSCFGDYYQWGRDTSGHEKRDSKITTSKEINYKNTSDKIVEGGMDWTSSDSDGQLRVKEWSKSDGSSVCPIGFRVPTIKELLEDTAEPGWMIIASDPSNQYHLAYADFLMLPYGGYRSISSSVDEFYLLNEAGYLWAAGYYNNGNSYYDGYGTFLDYAANRANEQMLYSRLYALNIRCIKE